MTIPETTEVVVKLNPAGGSNIEAINAAYGTTTIEVLVGSAQIYRLRVPAGAQADDVANGMRGMNACSTPNPTTAAKRRKATLVTSEPGAVRTDAVTEQYALDLLGLPDAHQFRRGQGVVVAVLDTGVQFDHPDLAGSWTTARYDFIDDDADPTDAGGWSGQRRRRPHR